MITEAGRPKDEALPGSDHVMSPSMFRGSLDVIAVLSGHSVAEKRSLATYDEAS
jgi:hypothetical protein